MSAIKIERDWFFPKSTDGNLSLSTQEERINQALASMQPGDWLEVDGIKCCSRDEILAVLRNPHVQVPMNNPNPQAIPIVCPNCGANTTNRRNCEYCGSALVRFADQNVAIDQNVFGKNALSFSNVATALKKNLELQNDLSSSEVVLTEFILDQKSAHDFDVWVYGGNITSETRYVSNSLIYSFNIGDANIPSSSEPRLILCFATPFMEHTRERFLKSCYVSLFSCADIPLYVKGEVWEKKKGNRFTDRYFYYLDIGQDYESATKIITDIYQRIYDATEDCLEVKTEKLSLEQQRNYVATEPKGGCSVALLPILGIGAGVAAGVVKLITHLLV